MSRPLNIHTSARRTSPRAAAIVALGIAAVWGLYGVVHFYTSSKKKDKPVMVQTPHLA